MVAIKSSSISSLIVAFLNVLCRSQISDGSCTNPLWELLNDIFIRLGQEHKNVIQTEEHGGVIWERDYFPLIYQFQH